MGFKSKTYQGKIQQKQMKKKHCEYQLLASKKQMAVATRAILKRGLYVKGWQAFDFFSYVLKHPKATIQNPSSEDFQLNFLAIALDQNKLIAWVAEVEWVEQTKNCPAVWKFTNPNYRSQGVSKMLFQIMKGKTENEGNPYRM